MEQTANKPPEQFSVADKTSALQPVAENLGVKPANPPSDLQQLFPTTFGSTPQGLEQLGATAQYQGASGQRSSAGGVRSVQIAAMLGNTIAPDGVAPDLNSASDKHFDPTFGAASAKAILERASAVLKDPTEANWEWVRASFASRPFTLSLQDEKYEITFDVPQVGGGPNESYLRAWVTCPQPHCTPEFAQRLAKQLQSVKELKIWEVVRKPSLYGHDVPDAVYAEAPNWGLAYSVESSAEASKKTAIPLYIRNGSMNTSVPTGVAPKLNNRDFLELLLNNLSLE